MPMGIVTKTVCWHNEKLTICNQRVLFWENTNTLILSDLHIGKTAHFRKNGIPISAKVLHNDINRLEAVINHFKPERIIVVGDLFHAEYNPDVIVFQQWFLQFKQLSWILVQGNHDKNDFKLYEATTIKVVRGMLELKPFTFIHDIEHPEAHKIYITGHTHPGVFLKGKGKQRIKLPCFLISTHNLVLPAFSLFSGLNTSVRMHEPTYYVFTEDAIFKV